MQADLRAYLLFTIFMGTTITVSLVINGLILICFFRQHSKLNSRCIFLVSLAVSDIIQSAIVYPLELSIATRTFATPGASVGHRHGTCDCVGFLVNFFDLVSINHFIFLAIERTVSISSPYTYFRFMTHRKHKVFIVLSMWLYGLLVALMPTLGFSKYELSANGWQCQPRMSTNVVSISYLLFFLLNSYILPLVVFIVCYVIAKREMKQFYVRSRLVFGRRKSSVATLQAYSANRKHDRMIVIMGAVFISTCTPFVVLSVTSIVGLKQPATLVVTAALLQKITTVTDPIIYAIIYGDFYRAIRQMFVASRERSSSAEFD